MPETVCSNASGAPQNHSNGSGQFNTKDIVAIHASETLALTDRLAPHYPHRVP
jgi:hypothetical protein